MRKSLKKQLLYHNVRAAQQSLILSDVARSLSKVYVLGDDFYSSLQLNARVVSSSLSDVKKIGKKGLDSLIEQKLQEEKNVGFVPATQEALDYLEQNFNRLGDGVSLSPDNYRAVVFGKKD